MDIVIKNLHKSFADNKVLNNLDLIIKENRTTCLMGQSGAGKTTLLNILMGFFERHILSRTNNPKVHKLKNAICLVLTLATLLLIIGLVVALVVPQLTSCIKLLIDKIPGAIDKVVAFASQYMQSSEQVLAVTRSTPRDFPNLRELIGPKINFLA